MAFYSPKLRETFGGWHVLNEILLKKLLRAIPLTFKELSTLFLKPSYVWIFTPNSFVQWSKLLHLCWSRQFPDRCIFMCFPQPNLSALFCEPSVQVEEHVKIQQLFGSGYSHTILTICSTEANGPPLSWTFSQVSTSGTRWSGVSCNNQDNGGTHRTPHSQASNSPHRKLEYKVYTFWV
jgi:hypothetical protein